MASLVTRIRYRGNCPVTVHESMVTSVHSPWSREDPSWVRRSIRPKRRTCRSTTAWWRTRCGRTPWPEELFASGERPRKPDGSGTGSTRGHRRPRPRRAGPDEPVCVVDTPGCDLRGELHGAPRGRAAQPGVLSQQCPYRPAYRPCILNDRSHAMRLRPRPIHFLLSYTFVLCPLAGLSRHGDGIGNGSGLGWLDHDQKEPGLTGPN